MAQAVTERFGGEVPSSMEDLTTLPGVGRKTANVVRSVALDLPGFPVDTHVGRLTRRLGLTEQTDPVKVESEIDALVPPEEWGALSLRLILHGRKVCVARKPAVRSASWPTSAPRRGPAARSPAAAESCRRRGARFVGVDGRRGPAVVL